MRAFRDFLRDLTLRPQGATLVLAGFLPIFAIVSMFPLVASMIQHFASDPDARAKVPLMVTAPGLTIAILSPFAGYFVDRFGRRRPLLIATFFYGFFGAAPYLLDDLDLIFASRLMLGVCEAAILTVINTLIADYWEDRGRRNWLFLQGVAGPFLSTGVIILSGTVASIRWNGGFLVYLVAFPIWLAMLLFLFEPKATKPESAAATGARVAKPPFPLGAAVLVGAMTLFSAMLYYVFIVNGSLVFAEVGVTDPGQVGELSAIPTLFIIAGAFCFRLLAGRSNAVQIAAFLGTLGLGLAAIGFARDVQQLRLALCIQQIGAGMAVPTLIAWAQTKFPFEHRGRGMGIWSSAFFLGQFVSPAMVHQFDLFGGSMQGAFRLAGFIALAVTVGALVLPLRRSSPLPSAKS